MVEGQLNVGENGWEMIGIVCGNVFGKNCGKWLQTGLKIAEKWVNWKRFGSGSNWVGSTAGDGCLRRTQVTHGVDLVPEWRTHHLRLQDTIGNSAVNRRG